DEAVTAAIPKFSYEYSLTMNDILCTLGMPTAFDANKADFSKLATSSNGNIYIGQVLHKTCVSVDELGTKAGAVTIVEMDCGSSMPPKKTVTLDRPFLFMITDTSTNLPVFIGMIVEV
ncbi:MAG: serpin family protein, partial [Acutalibacteraceae bacterium]|nr:serpin family protein [Acutalibacteraceae bacterium]